MKCRIGADSESGKVHKRFRRSLRAARAWCRAHLHEPLITQWLTLRAKLLGHYEYYGIRGNLDALNRFRTQVWWAWVSGEQAGVWGGLVRVNR